MESTFIFNTKITSISMHQVYEKCQAHVHPFLYYSTELFMLKSCVLLSVGHLYLQYLLRWKNVTIIYKKKDET